ncbi:MAG TPA: nitroreductase family protein [Rugosimonospora sp.]|nr:nitroreductase family protein [Rugosimonospora sp.]
MNTPLWTVNRAGQPGAALAECLRAATAAPSIHNSQPWRFRLGHGIEVHADRTRLLPAIDPTGRELMISLGAAILNLRLAILDHGRLPLLRLLPEPTNPDLAARVTIGHPVRPDTTIQTLAAAIPRRHTNRHPFHNTPVPADVLDELHAAADVEGARLARTDPVGRDAILSLVRTADDWQRAEHRYRAELTTWTTTDHTRPDGIPATAFGPHDSLAALPLRDFGLTRPDAPRRTATFEPHPTIVLLSTFGDSPRQWLRAGQALQRVLLTATIRGLAATPMTQPLEYAELRNLLVDTRQGMAAQVILRLGYGPPAAGTPRRPLSEVLASPA